MPFINDPFSFPLIIVQNEISLLTPPKEKNRIYRIKMVNLKVNNSLLMFYILVSAVFFAALRTPTEGWTEVVYTLSAVIFIFGISRAYSDSPKMPERRWWCGFVAFGAFNLIINGMRLEANVGAKLPTIHLSLAVVRVFLGQASSDQDRYRLYAIANALTSLFVGLVGGTIFASLERRKATQDLK